MAILSSLDDLAVVLILTALIVAVALVSCHFGYTGRHGAAERQPIPPTATELLEALEATPAGRAALVTRRDVLTGRAVRRECPDLIGPGPTPVPSTIRTPFAVARDVALAYESAWAAGPERAATAPDAMLRALAPLVAEWYPARQLTDDDAARVLDSYQRLWLDPINADRAPADVLRDAIDALLEDWADSDVCSPIPHQVTPETCDHPSMTGGVCDVCGYACAHPAGLTDSGECQICGYQAAAGNAGTAGGAL